MPRRDGSGPQGLGSRTGWGLGNCAPSALSPGQQFNSNPSLLSRFGGWVWNATLGRGLGRGQGRGRGGRFNQRF